MALIPTINTHPLPPTYQLWDQLPWPFTKYTGFSLLADLAILGSGRADLADLARELARSGGALRVPGTLRTQCTMVSPLLPNLADSHPKFTIIKHIQSDGYKRLKRKILTA